MRSKSYDRRRLPSYSAIVSTLALVVALGALCIGGAIASGVLVTSKQIKNGTILTQDIHKNGVESSDIEGGAVQSHDIKNGAVDSADIGNGEVEPQDVTMPPPLQLQEVDTATSKLGMTFGPVDVVGVYQKQDPGSILQVDWTGTAVGVEVPCIFQLRVDGQPAAAQAAEIYVGTTPVSVAASGLFSGLPPGPHTIEIWAHLTNSLGESNCTVGPAGTGVAQTFQIAELVV